MSSKRWSKDEVRKLYKYAEQTSQTEAARRLGRSYNSVKKKSSRLGITWFQGFASSRDIAELSGLSIRSVMRVIRKHYPDKIPCRANGKKPRARVPPEDVDEIVRMVKESSRGKCWTLGKVAREVGCSVGTVRRLVGILFHDREMFYFSGKVKKYKIDDKDAERLIKVLKGTRATRKHNIAGGKVCRKK